MARRSAEERRPVRVGVISDTHGHLPDAVTDAFEGVDAIVHAGDVGTGYVLDLLRTLAPVHAVRGNMDGSGEAAGLPPVLNVSLGGARLVVSHRKSGLPKAGIASADVAVSGHTHRAEMRQEGGVLFLNPGSAGDPRGGAPATVAIVEIDGTEVRARIVELRP